MLYWDSSALVASFIWEQETLRIHDAVTHHGERGYTSIITPIEIESAIQRRINERSLDAKDANQARLLALDFRKSSHLITLDHNVLDAALHLQKIYGLRPGDAIQLASARIGTDNPTKVNFFCLDIRLNDAALREGFVVPLHL